MSNATVTSIPDFLQLSGRVATAGMPNLEQFEAIADAGYEVVVNLAQASEVTALANEAAWVQQLGMQYVHIPVSFSAPAEQDFVRFVNAMNLYRDKQCFVHSVTNRRVAVFMALYQLLTGELDDGEAAWLQIKCIWQPDVTWQEFIDTMRDKFRDMTGKSA